MPKSTQQLKDQLRPGPIKNVVIPDSDRLSTGISLVNLAITGDSTWGVAKGKYIWIVGDSESGKTFLELLLLAEATLNKSFAKYRFIYDGPEYGAMMDTGRYFGAAVRDRIEPPSGTTKAPKYSETVKRFFFNLDTALKNDRPCIYLLDSFDCLGTETDESKFLAEKAARNGDKVKGSYGTAKAREISQNINRFVTRLPKSGSILVGISQTREDIGSPFGGKTYSGGKALRYYAHVQLWTSVLKTLKRTVLGKERTYGSLIKVAVRKNRFSGWHGDVVVPFLYKFGFDDIGANIDYLVEEGYWEEEKDSKKPVIVAKDFDFKGSREALVVRTEQENEERELQLLVQDHWRKIDDQTQIKRKSRYS